MRRLCGRPFTVAEDGRVVRRRGGGGEAERFSGDVDAVARGLSNAEIGRELFLSEGTVKAYLSAALGRLSLHNRVQLAALVWSADAGLAP